MSDATDTLDGLRERGWSIVSCSKPDLLSRLVEVVASQAAIISERPVEHDLRKAIAAFKANELNQLLRIVNKVLGEDGLMVLSPFAAAISRLCGREILFQRRPYLRANIPGLEHTATEPHSDVFYGHSPHAYTVWLPLHDIDADDGLYLFDRDHSAAIIRDYRFDRPLSAVLPPPMPQPLRPKFGEAIIFSCYLIHGARACSGPLARLSLDTRVQAARMPVFEKGAELYGYARL